ncbi:hypothetical protein [Chakrabartyella piscis]|uniref:hypothetical protein n=1 Tax=Chakrabartyella piscis TaxID=2918914 RepID=UPI0029586432|nr:hypothetical protein [Chakrabartyella piscis]
MARNRSPVRDYVDTTGRLAKYFGYQEDIFIKPMLDVEWAIRKQEEFYFLCYWDANGKKTEAMIVKRAGEPLWYQKNQDHMVVAIDCVKIGYIFSNAKFIGEK